MARTSNQLSDAKITQLQELGSAWVFKRAIKDNRTWKKWEDMRKDNGTMTQLKSIWKKAGGVEWNDKVDISGEDWMLDFTLRKKELIDDACVGG